MIHQRQPKGFTLIELTIVMAIAALILAGVLLAVGGAQRSQRDASRKSLAGRTATAINSYASNNSGDFTGFNCGSYCAGINDIDNATKQPVAGAVGAVATASSGVTYVIGATCGSGSNQGKSVLSSARSYALLFWSENAQASQCVSSGGAEVAVAPGGGGAPPGGGGGGGGVAIPVNLLGINYSFCNTDNPIHPEWLCRTTGTAVFGCIGYHADYATGLPVPGNRTLTLDYQNSDQCAPTPAPPASLYKFAINVYVNGKIVASNLQLDPSPGTTQIDLGNVPADATVSVEWTNDWYQFGYDANFQINNISIQ